MSYHSFNSRGLSFPYKAKSPTLRKIITYDEKELWAEIDRILAENKGTSYTPGTDLYYNLILCSDSAYFVDPEISMIIEEFMVMKKFNMPLANNIDEAEYERVVIFSAIDDEYNAILRKEQDVKK